MNSGVVEILTAPTMDSAALFSLRTRLVLEEEDKKALETFYTDYESNKRVIPEAEQSLRKGVTSYFMNLYAEALETLESEQSLLGKLLYIRSLQSLDKGTQAIKELTSKVDAAASAEDKALKIQYIITACDLRRVSLAEKIAEGMDFDSMGSEGLFVKSYINELNGEYQAALDGYGEAVEDEANPQLTQALFHLAKLQDNRGDDDLALETYLKLESLGVSYEESLINMGVIYEDKHDFAPAISCYERALKINPTNRKALLYHSDAEASLSMHYDEKKERQDMKTSEILNIPISDFELSVRSRNCLCKMGIFTLKDLIVKTEQELLSYKNFGETSLKEIRAMLSKKGLHLGMTRVEEEQLAERNKMNAQLYSQEKDFSLDQLDTSIEDLDLSYRTKSALHKMGFESLRDITMRTGTDLESNPNFSAACLQEVNSMLEEKGLSYRPATSTGKQETAPAAAAPAAGSSLLGEGSNEEETIVEYDE
ncbi:MAG: tetratricopeptide repeat protein [Planctomycetes bacterium]|nr:tetratricopeptide repeat protein [Planctomycetota bacterium]